MSLQIQKSPSGRFLTPESRLALRLAYASGQEPVRKLVSAFGVSRQTLYRITRGLRWNCGVIRQSANIRAAWHREAHTEVASEASWVEGLLAAIGMIRPGSYRSISVEFTARALSLLDQLENDERKETGHASI